MWTHRRFGLAMLITWAWIAVVALFSLSCLDIPDGPTNTCTFYDSGTFYQFSSRDSCNIAASNQHKTCYCN